MTLSFSPGIYFDYFWHILPFLSFERLLMKYWRYNRAFSLIELLLALAILGAMLSLAIPFGVEFVSKNRARAHVDELRAALQFSRALAIKLGERVEFCGSKDHKKCDGLWHKGYIVRVGNDKVIRVFSKIPAGDKLIWQGSFGKDSGEDGIIFLPSGFPNGRRGHFYYCPNKRSENALAVILEATGRARIANKTADNKVINCDF